MYMDVVTLILLVSSENRFNGMKRIFFCLMNDEGGNFLMVYRLWAKIVGPKSIVFKAMKGPMNEPMLNQPRDTYKPAKGNVAGQTERQKQI